MIGGGGFVVVLASFFRDKMGPSYRELFGEISGRVIVGDCR